MLTSPGETFAATAAGSSIWLSVEVLFAFDCWSMPQATDPMTVAAARLSTPIINGTRFRRFGGCCTGPQGAPYCGAPYGACPCGALPCCDAAYWGPPYCGTPGCGAPGCGAPYCGGPYCG